MKFTFSLLILSLFIFSCDKKRETSKTIELDPPAWVVDSALILAKADRLALTESIAELESNVGSQIVVLFVDTLHGMDLNRYSHRAYTTWGIGRSKYDDGILITVSLSDRKARIQVGQGLKYIISDSIAVALRQEFGPNFSKGQFYTGVSIAVEKMKKLIIEHKDLIGVKNPEMEYQEPIIIP